jgi:hypothetical protein
MEKLQAPPLLLPVISYLSPMAMLFTSSAAPSQSTPSPLAPSFNPLYISIPGHGEVVMGKKLGLCLNLLLPTCIASAAMAQLVLLLDSLVAVKDFDWEKLIIVHMLDDTNDKVQIDFS